MDTDFVERLLRLTSFEYCDLIWWRLPDPVPDGNGGWKRPDKDELKFLVGCNDVFYWGTADCEEVTAADIDALEATVREVEAIMGRYRGQDAFPLWVARKRRLRPQPPMYKHLDPPLHPLFDAVGPEREKADWA